MADNGKPLRILHVSALNLWTMKGNAGMCCLHETLRGHLRAGFAVTLILPRYNLFNTDPAPLPIVEDNEFDVHVAACSWLPAMKTVWSLIGLLDHWPNLVRLCHWMTGWFTWGLLTVSMLLAAMRLRYRGKRRFDLVYAHCEYAAPAGYLIGLLWRIPNVTRLYGTFLADLMRKPLVGLRYPIAAGGFLVPHHLLICANDGTRGDEVARRLGLDLGRFRFWQDGADRSPAAAAGGREEILARAPAGLRADHTWVLSCSRLSYWKRVDRILRAIAIARQRGCPCQALIAGDGPEKQRLLGLAAQWRLDGGVVWLGPVPHEEIWHLMHAADIFIIANDVTNRCNPLFEAIRAGLPVVSVRDPSTADLLVHGENALLAQPDDGTELGECLVRLCEDPLLAAQMRQAQRSREALLWTWQERMDVESGELRRLLETCSPTACQPGGCW